MMDSAAVNADAQHPWLGLDSFTEDTRGYFHGRSEEVAELSRRVQRSLLTVLFGQSGLGKTSILRAGIVPRLRGQGYCPVYVRVDYGPDAPPAADQIKREIFRATQGTGQWTQPGVALEGESLWEFLHHRDDLLHDEAGRVITPLLIFDQFEEIFTLAQADDGARERAQAFIDELADLVENRPPAELERRMEDDDSLTERFDFARSDYRILIALREDYLAHLESLKRQMPSITQNRIRLARMTGTQALDAVLKPGGRLVSSEVAEAIVRFVAGGAELRNAEVEPSLLSLICRELNSARLAQGREEITADLLAGSHDTILAEFYERSLAGQPPAVRKFLEDELLTESGYRENIAEERVRQAFAAAGATPDTLATLVNRRLLRIEERLDVRRVELTHDVLCGVVRASRSLRREREALEAAERDLAAQREQEAATRRALKRARQIAAACAVLAAGAVVGAGFGYYNMVRARDAQADALKARQLADVSRGEAEKLVAFLLDDFYEELVPVGRLEAVGSLAKTALDYYRQLPAELRTPATQHLEVRATTRLVAVQLARGNSSEAGQLVAAAEDLAAGLRSRGDGGSETSVTSALARAARGAWLDRLRRFSESATAYGEALSYLAPAVDNQGPSHRVLHLRLTLTGASGIALGRFNDPAGKPMLVKARELARELNALELSDVRATMAYIAATLRLAEYEYFNFGNAGEGRQRAEEALSLAGRVLQQRPDHRPALRLKALSARFISRLEYDDLRIQSALKLAMDQHSLLEQLRALDPSSSANWLELAETKLLIGNMLRDLGRVDEAMRWGDEAAALAQRIKLDALGARSAMYIYATLAGWRANLGEQERASALLAQARKFAVAGRSGGGSDIAMEHQLGGFAAQVALAAGHPEEALRESKAALKILEGGANDSALSTLLPLWTSNVHASLARIHLQLGDLRAAEVSARECLRLREAAQSQRGTQFGTQIVAQSRSRLAHVMLRQGRLAEAQALLTASVPFMRSPAMARGEDNEVQVSRAYFIMLYGMAFATERRERLGEAAALFDSLPSGIRQWKSFAEVRDEITRELAKP